VERRRLEAPHLDEERAMIGPSGRIFYFAVDLRHFPFKNDCIWI
jgi:hypothetical protein